MRKFLLSLVLCVAMVLSLPGMVHAQELPFWNYMGKNYLYVNEKGGFTRVFIDSVGWYSYSKTVFIEEYDSNFQIQSKYEITAELPLFGGFFNGAEYNYMVFGQENPNEDNNVEVIRVVKYSKNWEYLGQTSICGANTTIPFRSGSCRCAEYDGMLYIRTCHQMYKSYDGKNHQANMMLAIRKSDMVLTDKYWGVTYANTGYVSHSFDQYVITDQEKNIVALDLGDAYPRALVLTRFNGKAGSEKLGTASSSVIQAISGKIGDNRTGMNIGGFAETDSGYVTAYAYSGGSGAQSVYLAYTNKSDLSTRTIQLSAPGASVSTPKLVSMGTSGGYVLWDDKTSGENILYYATYSADGTIGEFHAANAAINGKAAIFFNGKIVWTDRVRTNIQSGEVYDIAMNIYLLDDTGVEVISIPAMYPYPMPFFTY